MVIAPETWEKLQKVGLQFGYSPRHLRDSLSMMLFRFRAVDHSH